MRFRLSYVGIQVRDIDRSLAFYRDLLGMQVVRRARVPETGGEWVELRSPDSHSMLELNWYPEGSAFFAGPYRRGDELDHIAFDCEDVERAYRDLLARGVPSARARSSREERFLRSYRIRTASGSNSPGPDAPP